MHMYIHGTPVLKAGHPVSYSSVVCLFVSVDGGFLGFFLLLSVCLLVYYIHIRTCILYSVFPCITKNYLLLCYIRIIYREAGI